ncbi:bifunctional aspartate kinase/diaminopimelate decarboxylase [Persicimonas caeni]|uniref:Diaminopimelate decarboxylase n=1 Tax=Persicimonas caeni TaxID=2292766 RepID=A0A4Y6PY62_PERCE|nr:bifunctional aspartate kinase/diaminopimelate decarboxylase [Persicimonas caeni]QDG53251.1 bifunctional aspartate kinase/diaminopimelate decarboxylase [Persicimonas caeni]QED34473.1 bifunctional aspartate kinase/diaminopimelate decarboxylase [Persicimonas caeni]
MPSASQEWIVLKFGGTSVSTLERWKTIAEELRKRIAEGARPFVVCSALSGISNMLEALVEAAPGGDYEAIVSEIEERHRALAADLEVDVDELLGERFKELERLALGASLIGEASPRFHARVLAMGELMSTSLGAAYLESVGVSASWRDARQMLSAVHEPNINLNRRYLSAACECSPDAGLKSSLAEGDADVFVTQGFIASDAEGDTVLLGRGGSDTSAAYFAAKLEAERLEIWTDVPGMFSANPRDIPSARLLRQLDYDEAQELATMGAKVLHPRCIAPVRNGQIPLHIRCTQRPELEGTVISGEVPNFGAQVKAISAKNDVTLISMDTLGMWQQVGFLADAFGAFKQNGLSVDLVTTSEANVTVSLDPMANALEPQTVEGLLEDLNAFCDARQIGPCAVVSLIGRNIRSILDELGPAFEVFDEQHIYLLSQAASDLNLTFVVDEDQAQKLVRKLHAQLFSERISDKLFGPTWRELFGGEMAEVAERTLWWQDRRDDLLEVAEEGAAYVYDAPTLQQKVDDVRSIDALDRVFYAMKANSHPDVLRLFEKSGIGFECVSPGEVERIVELFPDIDRERILFTPNFAPRDEYAFGFEQAGFLTLDNLHPLEAWPELFADKEVIVRLDPGRGRGHHKYVRTAGNQSKFGVAPNELDRLSELVEAAGARVVGLHAHVGSGIRTADTWSENALFLASLRDRFPELRLLNLGGGMGVPERPGQRALDVAEVSERLAKFKAAQPDFELWLEPGRYLVAQAGVLLARVTQTKQKGDINYVGLETGMNSLIRPALYGAYHEIVNLSRLDEPMTMTAEIVGPICETGDVLGHARRLPATEEGDVILVGTAGAYGRAMSSQYNLRQPAREVLLK